MRNYELANRVLKEILDEGQFECCLTRQDLVKSAIKKTMQACEEGGVMSQRIRLERSRIKKNLRKIDMTCEEHCGCLEQAIKEIDKHD